MENQKVESRIAVLIFLPEEISSVIKDVKDKTSVHYSNHETLIPHITLYSCKFDELKYPELIGQLKSLEFKAFDIKIKKVLFSRDDKNRNIFSSIIFENENTLRDLHEKVLTVGNQLRGNLIREKDTERFRTKVYSPEEFSIIEKYGYPHVKNYFNPHITIGGVDEDDLKTAEIIKNSLKKIEEKNIRVDKIYTILSKRTIPDEKKVSDSEYVEISLENQ